MWNQIRLKPTLEQCPRIAPMRGFSPETQPIDAPETSRCDRCDWRNVCPGGTKAEPAPLPSGFNCRARASRRPLRPLTPSILGPLYEEGVHRGLRAQQPTDGHDHSTGYLFCQHPSRRNRTATEAQPWAFQPNVIGQAVLVKDAVFTVNWKGEIVLKLDPFARMLPDDDPSVEDLKVCSTFKQNTTSQGMWFTPTKSGVGKTGKTWHRKA